MQLRSANVRGPGHLQSEVGGQAVAGALERQQEGQLRLGLVVGSHGADARRFRRDDGLG